jgi:4-amino-4-deoxy-L-arabinose transferase-like glycosyltransferase
VHKKLFFIILFFALLVRLFLFSGDGLGDDANYFASYYRIYHDHRLIGWDYDYRVFFWLPILFLWHLFGITEYSWILYITLCSIGTVALTFLILREWYGETAGVIGAALMAVNPFDVAFSTMFAVDIPMTFFMGLSLLLFIRARKKQYSALLFSLSAIALFMGFSTKMLAFFMLPVFGIFMFLDHKNLRKYFSFWIVLTILMASYLGVVYGLTGDFLAHFHAQQESGGYGLLNTYRLLDYPVQMFWKPQYDRFFHGFYFHLAGLCLILCLWHRKEALQPLIYLFVVFVLMEFLPHKYENGHFYTVQRIYRYLSPLVLPCVLFVSFFWWKLLEKSRGLFTLLFMPFVLVSLYQAYDLSYVTRDAFSDPRDAAAFISTLPQKPVHSDWHMTSYIERFRHQYKKPFLIRPLLEVEDQKARAKALHGIVSGYVVTGGARLPYYGCPHCINNIGNMDIPHHWVLLKEFDKPLNAWREEPLRVWEVVGANSSAS